MQEHPLGLLSQGTTIYLKRRLSIRFDYLLRSKRRTSKFPSKYLQGWGRQLNGASKSTFKNSNLFKWYILIDIALFIKRLRKLRNRKNLSRINVLNEKSNKQIKAALFAITLSILLLPLLYVFNIGLKSYQYINIYISCCLCYQGMLRFILFFTLPAYVILIVMAIIFAGVELIRQVPLLTSKKQSVHQILFGK
ncbi:unnamed protein product (macronuclear) [Paramecium tetraurelia]|uniref:G-protein coupled receptors family 1 profile domain-containing protein n=1 Tax=Paramecium tetraurelia TaxID=5888 RepID=A0BQA8_PARTE|nr:uncharacterized protein GSPATT00030954001 [Paramecium tetraurelia]CAK60725.1 unnamed protein product [Paramecium tetraurelia]|eukprot:XP_001428123.1 hypothetical protein (macronuclear) [Paramecium tetraurelia strain d4-2]